MIDNHDLAEREFLKRHPEFKQCKTNATKIAFWFAQHTDEIYNVESLEKAFGEIQNELDLYPREWWGNNDANPS